MICMAVPSIMSFRDSRVSRYASGEPSFVSTVADAPAARSAFSRINAALDLAKPAGPFTEFAEQQGGAG